MNTSQQKPLTSFVQLIHSLTFKYALSPVAREVFFNLHMGITIHYVQTHMWTYTWAHTYTARLYTDASEGTHPSTHVCSFSAHSYSHSTLGAPLLPLWLCCRVSSMLAESVAPSSASLRLVALSSDRRLVTSWLAD